MGNCICLGQTLRLTKYLGLYLIFIPYHWPVFHQFNELCFAAWDQRQQGKWNCVGRPATNIRDYEHATAPQKQLCQHLCAADSIGSSGNWHSGRHLSVQTSSTQGRCTCLGGIYLYRHLAQGRCKCLGGIYLYRNLAHRVGANVWEAFICTNI